VPMFGLVDLGTLFGLSDPRYEWPMSLEASWGSLFTFFVAAGFAWVGALPARPWPGLVLVTLAAGGLTIAALVFADGGPLWVAVVLGLAVGALLLLLRSAGRPGTVPGASGTVPLAPRTASGASGGASGTVPFAPAPLRCRPAGFRPVVGGFGVLLWLGYAWHSYAAAVAGIPGDVTNGIDHWPVQVALGLALAGGCVLLVLWSEPLSLWRWAFAATAGFVAYATLVFPDRGGAMPHLLWGVAIAVWGGLVAVVPQSRSDADDRQRRTAVST